MSIKEIFEYWCTFDEDTKKELLSITDEKEIEDRFYKELEFGTGGLRGVIGAGTNRMNIYTVRKATQGLANYVKSSFDNPVNSIIKLISILLINSGSFLQSINGILVILAIYGLNFADNSNTPHISNSTCKVLSKIFTILFSICFQSLLCVLEPLKYPNTIFLFSFFSL